MKKNNFTINFKKKGLAIVLQYRQAPVTGKLHFSSLIFVRLLLPICLILLLGTGCTLKSNAHPIKNKQKLILKQVKAESEKLAEAKETLVKTVEKVFPEKVTVEPLMPVYTPLDDHIVSFSVMNEGLQTILYSLARSAGMNIVIEPGITAQEKLLTLNFAKVPASKVLKEIMNIYDLHYEIDHNIIRITPFKEQIFRLNFLDANVQTSFDVGGDVLGAGQATSNSGLSGNFKLSGKGAKTGNPYDAIENIVKQVISSKGIYSLNRLSGMLYVKDTPAVLKSIAKIINQCKEMLSRQILIEARIIEVTLSDEHKYGINWAHITDEAASYSKATGTSWAFGQGLIFSHRNKDTAINSTIDALNTFGDSRVISNPSIRSKHGKPALISVGTSFAYKKSIEVTEEEENGDTTTQVEVDTVFDGLILGVIPFIQSNGKITLLINPIKSDVDRSSLELENVSADGSQSIALPRVRIKEISTTIALHNKEVVILGGLIDKQRISNDKGIPFLSRIPVLGLLFKNILKMEETRELVIILSVTLI